MRFGDERGSLVESLQTERLTLKPLTKDQVLAGLAHLDSSERAQISEKWLQLLAASRPIDPWVHGFEVHHSQSRVLVGKCGFKGPPDEEGVVEIAYGMHKEHEGKGYATEAARALVNYGFASGKVRRVVAHTLPEVNASGRVLAKCGFRKVCEAMDPDDGLVWRWEIDETSVNQLAR